MAAEVKIPVGNAVELAEHAFISKLMNRTLSLLGSGQLPPVAEHVDTGKVKGAVGAHGLSQRGGLRHQGGFFHHMACQGNVVITAPSADIVRKGGSKPLTDMVMVMVTVYGNRALRELPDTLGKAFKEIAAVGFLVGFGEIIRKRKNHLFLFLRESKSLLMAELRLVRKNGGNRIAEAFSQFPVIGFMGELDESVYGPGI